MASSETKEEKTKVQVNVANTETKSNDEMYLLYPAQLQDDESQDTEKIRVEIEKKFTELLTAVSEETVQLSEFLIEEKKLIQDVCMLLRDILRRLNISFDVPVKAVPELQHSARKIVLNNEGHVILMQEGEKVSSKMVEDYPPQVVLAIIWSVIPELEKSLRRYRKRISQRVSIFEKIRKELKNIQRVFSPSEEKQDVFVIGNEELKNPISETRADKSTEGT
jgi:hypothetical protein